MPTTRKKIIKTVYKDEDDSETEITGDFSDSGSDAQISGVSSTDEESDEFVNEIETQISKPKTTKTTKFAKTFINKIKKQIAAGDESENMDVAPPVFSVKDMSDADKMLPSVLNLSESDSSDDDSPIVPPKNKKQTFTCEQIKESESDSEDKTEYKDVWSNNIKDESEEIARKTFMELEKHKIKTEETKTSIRNYTVSRENKIESDVKDLLALGEETLPQQASMKKKLKVRKKECDDSDSDIGEWEEVKDNKVIPQQGLQLVVDFPDAACRKRKKLDIEMMMKRKINRVKKEYQVYMHKVHVLCWLGYGNYVSSVLNDQDILAATLSMVPSKDCYPRERVDMKYIEQITNWYKDKLTLKQDKYENKFRPKAPPLKDTLLGQIKNRVVTTKKYRVFIFVSMLRALGLQCRIMFNFVTLPIKPPSSELCSLSTKPKDDSKGTDVKSKLSPSKQESQTKEKKIKKLGISNNKTKNKIPQLDGNYDDIDVENIMQVDGNDDNLLVNTRNSRITRRKINKNITEENGEDVSPPKRSRKSPKATSSQAIPNKQETTSVCPLRKRNTRNTKDKCSKTNDDIKNTSLNTPSSVSCEKKNEKDFDQSKTSRIKSTRKLLTETAVLAKSEKSIKNQPKVVNTDGENVSSAYFESSNTDIKIKRVSLSRKCTQTSNPTTSQETRHSNNGQNAKTRTKSASSNSVERSKYFTANTEENKTSEINTARTSKRLNKLENLEDKQRVSHRDLTKTKPKPRHDVTADLINIIKNRVKEAKVESRKRLVKGKTKKESDEDSDYLPEELPKRHHSDSEDDFKPAKISPKPSTSRKIDRRVLSSDEETPKNKIDVWCEVFVEELEQWIGVDVIKGQVHCTNEIYGRATHPVAYIVGWDNNNYLKDLTRKYVPQWNTVTRKQRAEPAWWNEAIQPWLGPKTARDKEEDEYLDKMQLEAPLPKSIAEYKNHPLYALKRHLLKFEAIYPPDAATLGFVRNEPVYARECVYVCKSRDTWLKDAKVVRLGEKPYKVVKARPKWDKLSDKLITDKPLEIFGPWQVQDYEPPVAENGVVPRNAYGNVELFKDCMLPKGTVHIKLPGLNKVARKLDIDCAPAMTGFDFNGGWSHPVYDGFVVCEEYKEIITEAWFKDQEEQERREREKTEARVYGNWKRLIKGLLIRERLKNKYGFEKPSTSNQNKKSKGPRLNVTKKYKMQ